MGATLGRKVSGGGRCEGSEKVMVWGEGKWSLMSEAGPHQCKYFIHS